MKKYKGKIKNPDFELKIKSKRLGGYILTVEVTKSLLLDQEARDAGYALYEITALTPDHKKYLKTLFEAYLSSHRLSTLTNNPS